MAKKQQSQEGPVRVRILVDCEHGKCNTVQTIDGALLEALDGIVDADPAAVAACEQMQGQ